MSPLEKKSKWARRFSTSLLLSITLFTPLKLFGVEQIEQAVPAESFVLPSSQTASSVPPTEQALPLAESAVPLTEQVLPLAESAGPPTEQASPLAESAGPSTERADYFGYIEAPRDYLSAKITRFANSIDRFFGGDRHYQESNRSVLQLNLTRVTGYGGDGNYKFAARLNLKLPLTEGRLRLLVETDPENNVADEQAKAPPVTDNKVSAPGSVALAVRFEKKEESRWNYNTDAGIKFRGITTAPNPFVRARGGYSTQVGEWRMKAGESVYWFNSLGVGETSLLDFERILSTQLLFRASSNVTWLHDKQNFDLRQDLTFFHTLDDRTALRYQASVIGVSNPQLRVTDYVVQGFYRYRLNRDWLFFELNPQLHFPLDKKYKSSPALSMRLEMLFDDTR